MIKTTLTTMRRIVSAFWFYSLVLALALCAWVWWSGPRLALDDWRPWLEPAARLLSIALIMLTWGAVIGLRGWRQSVRRQRGLDPKGVMARARRQAKRAATADMRLRFRVTQRRLSGGAWFVPTKASWRQSLPWFLLLGQPASGKTSLLEYSGLELPLNRRADLLERPPAPTAVVQWYFAEGGVVLDTAGGLMTNEDDHARYRWQALLNLLYKKRRGQPLNGIIACLPVSTLLEDNPAPLHAFATRLSDRLQEIHQQLRCTVPVYLVLTHADELRGFDTFFCDVGETEKHQVLGVGVEEDESQLDGGLLESKFYALIRHLHSQLIHRLHTERDARRLARMIALPDQLTALLGPLRQLVELTFTGNRYQPETSLLGVYLTAAPHRQEAVDLPAAPQETGATSESAPPAARDAVVVQDVHRTPMSGGRKASPMLGSARFITPLFNGIVFARAGLASLKPEERRRHRLFQASKACGLLAVMGSVTAMGVYAWRDGYAALQTVSALGEQLNKARREAVVGDDPARLLPRLDTSYAASQVFSSPNDQWLHYTGLFQSDESSPVLEQSYRYELDRHLLPAVARLLTDALRSSVKDSALLRQNLRLYLMLNDLPHRDTDQLREYLLDLWATRYPGQHAERARLGPHLDRLLQRPFVFPLDDRLVTQVRQLLRASQGAQAVYEALKKEARGLPDFRFDRHLDPQGQLFIGTDQVIPGLYTRAGYEQFFSGKGLDLVQHSRRDGWLLGDADLPDPGHVRRLMLEVEGLYLNDYANHWSEALSSISLLPLDRAAQAAEQARALTAPDSPLVKLLNEVRDNTRLTLPVENMSASKAMGNREAPLIQAAKEIVAVSLPDRARRGLAQRFAQFHRLLAEDGGPSPDLIAVLHALNSLQLQLDTLGSASHPDFAAFELAKSRMAGGTDGFTALQRAAARVPLPMRDWLMHMADDSWRQVLDEAYRFVNRRYQDELFKPYEQRIARRFPFKNNSEREVAVPDFQAFFKRDGLADSFYDTYLKPFAINGEHRMRVVGGRSLPVSAHTLRQFRKVNGIQSSFFADTPDQLGIVFRLQPYSMDATLHRATFTLGDTQVEYRHGPIMIKEFRWPVAAEHSVASLVTERFDGKAVGFKEAAGAWSLFRLLDRMESEPHRGMEIKVLKAEVAGARVNYLLTTRLPDPFDPETLRGFALPMAL